jgi:hypothetical protein
VQDYTEYAAAKLKPNAAVHDWICVTHRNELRLFAATAQVAATAAVISNVFSNNNNNECDSGNCSNSSDVSDFDGSDTTQCNGSNSSDVSVAFVGVTLANNRSFRFVVRANAWADGQQRQQRQQRCC